VQADKEPEVADLVQRIISGDTDAEEQIIRLHQNGVAIIINRIVKNPLATEDLCQEAFLKVLEKIRRNEVREPERVSGFICAVARNIAIEYIRKLRQLTNQEEIGKAEQIADPALSQLEQLCRKEREKIIQQVISELKMPRDREVLLRYYIAEEDKELICRNLNLTREQFSRVLFRALERYRELYLKMVEKP
jgi:RNA polymerase sigma-70 factor, ECF subfamily